MLQTGFGKQSGIPITHQFTSERNLNLIPDMLLKASHSCFCFSGAEPVRFPFGTESCHKILVKY